VSQALSQPETQIAEALKAGDLEAAARLTFRAYGSEILGFLIADLRSDQHAEEVFSSFAEDLWRALPALELRTTMRAYAYSLARNARHRFLDRDLRKQKRGLPLSQVAEISKIAEAVRTATGTHQHTSAQQRLADLRAKLSSDEQALLTLRIDRKLGWREIAEVLEGDQDLTRAAARQRKRFQLLKDKLTRWAQEEGLLDKDESSEG
jgi:RNA polymerase sigma-70 factor (ECF subfamily)